jgi:HTH-type transcriptional regulator/antitoxin HigA
MSTVIKKKAMPRYLALIQHFPLIHIKNDAQHKLASAMLDNLVEHSLEGELEEGEQAYYLALIDLLAAYENDKFLPEEKLSPIQMVKYLMDANQLKQSDLVVEFGSRSLVSEFMSGNRSLSLAQIKKLSGRFCVSPEAFMQV